MVRKMFMVLVMLSLNGCSYLAFWQDASPLQVVVNIEAANNINPNIDGLASPLEIRFYQLQDSEAFNQASFIDLYNDDQGVLKAGLLSKRSLDSVLPNEKRQVVLPLITETKYVGVVAAFADYREAKNKAILPVQAGQPIVIDARIDGINVSIIGQED
ncbi:type VI secretion system lipoprotein TssJ [Photobacterium lipolyticum]|uniref:Type VI secretion system lipoprotein TssJ n=1 Tax=Photobacterium lipolyticum TaxID=266810 RepID=A0A2T3N0B7_9GAMM|nr:type VI secretion system lipoprotein TssJ [Photobacterium lipolyticum]PSW05691.1 type VI secretion system lipoprotein TssJ [Photobacterium lipolyticum]